MFRWITYCLVTLLVIAGLYPFVVIADPYYDPHVEFGGYYFYDTPHTAGVLRAFVPVGIDDPDHLL